MTYQDNRLENIFQCIVEAYVETAVPVGSKVVAERYHGNLSPASIRTVMSELEELGFVLQPHISAGRIPTAKGYRYYVDTHSVIMEEDTSTFDQLQHTLVHDQDIEDIAESISDLLSDLTQNAGLCLLKNIERVSYIRKAQQHEAQPEARSREYQLVVRGTSQLFDQPEFNDIQRARQLMHAFEVKRELAEFMQREWEDEDAKVYIGDELDCPSMHDMSMVVQRYTVNGTSAGCLGVVGPIRMKYDHTVNVVNHAAKTISQFLNDL